VKPATPSSKPYRCRRHGDVGDRYWVSGRRRYCKECRWEYLDDLKAKPRQERPAEPEEPRRRRKRDRGTVECRRHGKTEAYLVDRDDGRVFGLCIKCTSDRNAKRRRPRKRKPKNRRKQDRPAKPRTAYQFSKVRMGPKGNAANEARRAKIEYVIDHVSRGDMTPFEWEWLGERQLTGVPFHQLSDHFVNKGGRIFRWKERYPQIVARFAVQETP
jgi:hypothetical protein